MTAWARGLRLALVSSVALAACTEGSGRDRAESTTTTATRTMSPLRDRPLPPPVSVRDRPDGVALADPAFEALPGAHAEFGTLGGAVYQIEMPDQWNGRVVLWMHGFEDLAPEANATAPDFRRYLIAHGFAWAASSFSSTSLIPGRAADETAALWDYFVTEHGRPTWSYVAGMSMGGWAAHIAAERYGDRFDGALGLCGAAGTTPGLRISAEVLVAGAYVAGVTQAEFDSAPSASDLIERRIRPALDDPEAAARFEDLMIDLTGGPRAFAREGIQIEEETNWRRASLLVATRLVPPRDAPYELRADAGVTSRAFNRDAVRLPTDDAALSRFADGTEVTGELQMPLLTVHTTGDGQVPINQAQILRQRVSAAGQSDRLRQRVIDDPGHCGFTTGEQEAAFDALVDWVERDRKPDGTNLDVDDLSALDHTFELQPRPGDPTDDGASTRTVITGNARLDGAPFDAQWIGAVVRENGLVTPCQAELPPIEAGRYEIAVFSADESLGCGRPGSEVLLWTFLRDQQFFVTAPIPWPESDTTVVDVDVDFSTANPPGAALATTEFNGEVFRPDGSRVAAGTHIEAYVDDALCGVASVRGTGSFDGYILSVVGPDSVPGCRAGATLTFRVDGALATETSINSPEHSEELDLTLG